LWAVVRAQRSGSRAAGGDPAATPRRRIAAGDGIFPKFHLSGPAGGSGRRRVCAEAVSAGRFRAADAAASFATAVCRKFPVLPRWSDAGSGGGSDAVRLRSPGDGFHGAAGDPGAARSHSPPGNGGYIRWAGGWYGSCISAASAPFADGSAPIRDGGDRAAP